jgi:hypothetical protein
MLKERKITIQSESCFVGHQIQKIIAPHSMRLMRL